MLNRVDRLLNADKISRRRSSCAASASPRRAWRPLPIRREFERTLLGLTLPLFIREDWGHSRNVVPRRLPGRPAAHPLADVPAPGRPSRSSTSAIPATACYRKYRYVAAGDVGVSHHLQTSAEWITRGENRVITPETRDEELRYITQPDPNHDALQRARRALGLDLVAFDYGYTPDGRMIVWEANPFPTIVFGTRRLIYRNPAIHRTLLAIVRMYLAAAGLPIPALIDDGLALDFSDVAARFTSDFPPTLRERLRNWERQPPQTRGVTMSRRSMADLWAITAYFNPMHWRRRRENYRRFRQALRLPLVAVELGYDGQFDLAAGDADVLLQFPAADVMWQKERLLNLALAAVPPHVDKIVAIDSDVIFLDDDPLAGRESARSIARRCCTPSRMSTTCRPTTHSTSRLIEQTRAPCLGFGWLRQQGRIDARALQSRLAEPQRPAAGQLRPGLGVPPRAVRRARLLRRVDHRRRHARPLLRRRRSLAGSRRRDAVHAADARPLPPLGRRLPRRGPRRLGLRPRRHRPPMARHDRQPQVPPALRRFRRVRLRPGRRSCLGRQRVWRWNTAKPEMHAYVRNYFAGRAEDDAR